MERTEFLHFIIQAETLLASMMTPETPTVSLELKKMIDGLKKRSDNDRDKDRERERDKERTGFIPPRSRPNVPLQLLVLVLVLMLVLVFELRGRIRARVRIKVRIWARVWMVRVRTRDKYLKKTPGGRKESESFTFL